MRGARSTERPLNRAPASSNSDPLQSRAKAEKSPKLSPHSSSSSNASNPRKLGTRIADLESQLGLAQEELKCLKDQLSTTQVAKKVALKPKKQEKVHKAVEVEEQHLKSSTEKSNKQKDSVSHVTFDDSLHETDVFEVPTEKLSREFKNEEPEVPESPLVTLNKDEISLLKAKLEQKDRELESLHHENESLASQLDDKSATLTSAESEIDELKSRLHDAEQELEKSRTTVLQLSSRMEAVENEKEEMENEMKRLTVHTEQWRKAADAAAAVLAGGGDLNSRKLHERCGSMDTNYVNSLGFAGFVGSPAMTDDSNDVFGSEKRKASGIRVLGDMLKKRGPK